MSRDSLVGLGVAILLVGSLVSLNATNGLKSALSREAATLRAAIPPAPDVASLEARLSATLATYRPPDLTPAMADLKAMREMVEGAVGAMRRMESDVTALKADLERTKAEARQVVQNADSHIKLIEDILMTQECLDFDAALFTPMGVALLGPIRICGQNLEVRGE